MEISNISRICGKFRHAVLFGALTTLVACASGRKSAHTSPVMGPFEKNSSGEVTQTPSSESYGPFFAPESREEAPTILPELIKNPDRIVLVLGRGLAHGYAHVGVLRALKELKIPIQAIYGTEIGALASALYFTQPNPNRIDWALLRFSEKNLGPSEGKFSFSLQSPAADLDEKLKEVFGTRTIDDLSENLHVGLSDEETGVQFEPKSGEIWKAVRGALAGANRYASIELDGRRVRSSSRKTLDVYREARQNEKYPIIVVLPGNQTVEPFRKIVEQEKAIFLSIPLPGIEDLDLKKRNQSVFLGKSAIYRAKNEILELVGRNHE